MSICARHCLHMRIMLDKSTLHAAVLSDSAPTLQCLACAYVQACVTTFLIQQSGVRSVQREAIPTLERLVGIDVTPAQVMPNSST